MPPVIKHLNLLRLQINHRLLKRRVRHLEMMAEHADGNPGYRKTAAVFYRRMARVYERRRLDAWEELHDFTAEYFLLDEEPVTAGE